MKAIDPRLRPGGAPKVAVVIPCYNGRNFIREAIASVRAQTCQSFELLVVDDGSTDDSLAVIRGADAKVLEQQNAGVSSARNAGLKATTAPYVVFLDADDRLHPDALTAGLAELETDPSITMTFGANAIIDRDGHAIGRNPQPRARFGFWEVLAGVTPGPSQCMFRRSSLEQAGGFNPRFHHGEDWELYLRLVQLGPITCHGREISDYRSHPGQATRSPTLSFLGMLEILDAVEGQVAGTRGNHAMFGKARKHWATVFGQYLPAEAARALLPGALRRSLRCAGLFARHFPYSLAGFARYVQRRLVGKHTRIEQRS